MILGSGNKTWFDLKKMRFYHLAMKNSEARKFYFKIRDL